MQIELASRIGNCAFVLKAAIDIAETLKSLALNAMKQICFHDSASAVFKKDSGFERDSVYSPELAAKVEETFKAKLSAIGFSDISFVPKAFIKPTEQSKFYEYMTKQGLTKDVIDAAWAVHPKNVPAKTEEKPAIAPEGSAPISLS